VTELEWETKMGREEAAALLRRLADGLESGKKVKLESGGVELKVGVADEVELEVEVELDGAETEVEIELSWSTGGEELPSSDEGASRDDGSGDAEPMPPPD
jgi:amphi-Trp domain-containing protein